MRPFTRTILVSLLVVATTGCFLKKKKPVLEDEDVPPTNAPTVKVTGSGAKNEANVLRYERETKLPNEGAIVLRDVTRAREFPMTGKEVATLSAGTPVTKIAKYFSTGVLVTFDDPTTRDGTKLMGWVEPTAFLPLPGAATPPPTAVATTPPTSTAAKPATDAGAAAKTADAGAPVVDAGAPAGPTPTTPPPGTLQVLPTAGKCPGGFELIGPFCRRPCTTDVQCPKGTFCTSSAGKKSCSATK